MADYREEIPERFRIHYDGRSGVFRILDLWNEEVRNLPPDATISDDSPAMKTLSTIEVNALLGKLKEMGWIEKMFGQQQSELSMSQLPRRDVKEIAIENITKIVELSADQGVSKEAIISIKEVANKINSFKFEEPIKGVKGSSELVTEIPVKRGPGRPRKENK